MKTGKSNDNVILYPGRDQDERAEKAKTQEAEIKKIEEDRRKAQAFDAMREEELRIQKEIDEAVKFEEAHGPKGATPPLGATSMIASEEEESVKADIENFLTFAPPNPAGFLMAVMVYERKRDDTFVVNGQQSVIAIADETRARDKYEQVTGLVVAQGPRCYLPTKDAFQFQENWFRKLIRPFFGWCMSPAMHPPACKVGDWICFSRIEGYHLNYRGKPMVFLPDDKILCVVPHPSYVTRD